MVCEYDVCIENVFFLSYLELCCVSLPIHLFTTFQWILFHSHVISFRFVFLVQLTIVFILVICVYLTTVLRSQNCHVKGQIPLVGPDDTFNLNPMLLHNISKSPYFLKCCQNLHDWGSLVDEIYYEVKHMEPWADGTYVVYCCFTRILFPLCCFFWM